MHRELSQDAIRRASIIADRQERDAYRAHDDRQEAALQAFHASADRMERAVMRGDDEVLWRGLYTHSNITTVEALTEYCGEDARQVLLSACKHALFGADQEAALLLRKFVGAACANFADQWGDE